MRKVSVRDFERAIDYFVERGWVSPGVDPSVLRRKAARRVRDARGVLRERLEYPLADFVWPFYIAVVAVASALGLDEGRFASLIEEVEKHTRQRYRDACLDWLVWERLYM